MNILSPAAGVNWVAKDTNMYKVIGFALLLAFALLLEIEHFIFTVFGAVVWGVLSPRLPSRKADPDDDYVDFDDYILRDDDEEDDDKLQKPHALGPEEKQQSSARRKPHALSSEENQLSSARRGRRKVSGIFSDREFKPPTKSTATVMPVDAPIFKSQGWDNEVMEFLPRLMPSEAGLRIVTKVADGVRKVVKLTFPEMEVRAFACGDPAERAAFCVALPQVEVVLQCNPRTLVMRLNAKSGKQILEHERASLKVVRKSAIRSCTDLLVYAGFKFRRSSFREVDPKVRLLAPAALFGPDGDHKSIPITLSVNDSTPLHNAGIMAAAAALDNRALELALLVKRWAKDRGVCMATKGYFPHYVWNILTLFFLQAGARNKDRTALLPPLKNFDWSVLPQGLKPPPQTSGLKSPSQTSSTLTLASNTPKLAPSNRECRQPEHLAIQPENVGKQLPPWRKPKKDAERDAPDCLDKQKAPSETSRLPPWRVPRPQADCDTPTLLKEFFAFYASTINWETEAVSLQVGERGPVPKGVQVHKLVEDEDEASSICKFGIALQHKTRTVLTVVDPWDPQQNLAVNVSLYGASRMKEELCRAAELCGQDTSVSQLFELWAPPEMDPAEEAADGCRQEV